MPLPMTPLPTNLLGSLSLKSRPPGESKNSFWPEKRTSRRTVSCACQFALRPSRFMRTLESFETRVARHMTHLFFDMSLDFGNQEHARR